jgi:hypothetical protein
MLHDEENDIVNVPVDVKVFEDTSTISMFGSTVQVEIDTTSIQCSLVENKCVSNEESRPNTNNKRVLTKLEKALKIVNKTINKKKSGGNKNKNKKRDTKHEAESKHLFSKVIAKQGLKERKRRKN